MNKKKILFNRENSIRTVSAVKRALNISLRDAKDIVDSGSYETCDEITFKKLYNFLNDENIYFLTDVEETKTNTKKIDNMMMNLLTSSITMIEDDVYVVNDVIILTQEKYRYFKEKEIKLKDLKEKIHKWLETINDAFKYLETFADFYR